MASPCVRSTTSPTTVTSSASTRLASSTLRQECSTNTTVRCSRRGCRASTATGSRSRLAWSIVPTRSGSNCASNSSSQPDSGVRHLDQPAQRIDEPHLVGRSAPDVQQLGAAGEHGEAAGSRDGDVEPVAAEEEVEVARDLLAAGRRQREEDNRRLLALELVDGADMYAAGQMGPKAAHLSVVRR